MLKRFEPDRLLPHSAFPFAGLVMFDYYPHPFDAEHPPFARHVP
jgi:hypothetical protein